MADKAKDASFRRSLARLIGCAAHKSEQAKQHGAKTLFKVGDKRKVSLSIIKQALRYDTLERSVVRDKNFLYTIASHSVIVAIFMNLNTFQSPLIGLMASVIYFAINAVFLGNAFFEKENAFLRLMFGILLLIMLLGFVGWLTLIIYNLDVTRCIFILWIVATFSSFSNRNVKHSNATK